MSIRKVEMLGQGPLSVKILVTTPTKVTRKPADLAILKSIGQDATQVEHDIVEVFSQKDDFMSDFEFTPIRVAVLEMYSPKDAERPPLQKEAPSQSLSITVNYLAAQCLYLQ